MGNNINKKDRPEDWHIPGTNCSKKCQRLRPFIIVVIETPAVLCICGWSTVHSVISPAGKHHEPNAYPVGPFAQYIGEVSSVIFPRLHAVFTKRKKQETVRRKWFNF